MARTQGARESIQDYFLDKVWLCEGLDFSVNEIRDEIASDLWSRELAQHMTGKDYTTTDSMLQDLVLSKLRKFIMDVAREYLSNVIAAVRKKRAMLRELQEAERTLHTFSAEALMQRQ